MNTKHWALFFVVLFSFDYATATYYGGYKGVSKQYDESGDGYYGWSGGCRCNDDLITVLDRALDSGRTHLGKYKKGIQVKDHILDDYEFRDGRVGGFHQFHRKGPYRCSLSHNYARVYINIGFVRLYIHYTVSLVEDLLTSLVGGIGTLIGKILDGVTDFLFHIILPDVQCTIVLYQRLGGSGGFLLEGLYLNNINDISYQNKRFQKHESSITPYFRPFCDHLLRNIFHEQLRGAFHKCFKDVKVDREMFYYESNKKQSRYEYDEKYDNDDDNEDDDY